MRINGEIREFIVSNFLIGQTLDLQDNDSFLEKGLFDSTGILELVSFIESTYKIQLEPEELVPENLDSIAAITHFLERKLAAVAPAPEVRV